MTTTDPDTIDVDENSIYARTSNPPGTVTHPEDRGETDPRRLTIHAAKRGPWSVEYLQLEPDEEDVAERLTRDAYGRFERTTPEEFVDLLA